LIDQDEMRYFCRRSTKHHSCNCHSLQTTSTKTWQKLSWPCWSCVLVWLKKKQDRIS